MADAKNVAKKSSNIVERMSGVENTNRRPSIPAARLRARFEPSARPEIPRMASTAPITKRNDAALHAYAHGNTELPDQHASRCGADDGRCLEHDCGETNRIGKSSAGTSVGIKACRAGLSNAPNAAPVAASA